MDWQALADKSLAGQALSPEEAHAVLEAADHELLELIAAAYRLRRHYFGNRVKLNFLANIKSGICQEDCYYCSQSKISRAPIDKYPFLAVEDVLAAAERARQVHARRLCLVASGRGPSHEDIAQVAAMVGAIKQAHPDLEICCCLGFLDQEMAAALRQAGALAYNHNLNTSEEYYPAICSTHTYADRLQSLLAAKAGGLSPCSGCLFGMGESDQDIVSLAYTLREIGIDSIPINFLIAIPGTPLEGRWELTPARCLKILGLFRFLNPASEIRIAGGREHHLRWLQPLGLFVANSIFIGDYLTAKGQSPQQDLQMIRDLGFTIEGEALPAQGEELAFPIVLKDRSERLGPKELEHWQSA